ncbi:MAG: DUF3568 domain-containing protein [Planctomycetota bacterium]|nr:DUF3568 domain-containing protein [Planctomycetota bacterium]
MSVVVITYGILLSGCPVAWLVGGAAVGAGTYAYFKGELERKYPASFDKCWQASIRTLEHLQFTRESSTRDRLAGKIEARRADGTPITITIELISDKVTSIKVKVGMFGDREISERIHERIKENCNHR